MIFFSIGTQLPFDRFIKMVDTLAIECDEEFVVQAIPGDYKPANIRPVGLMTHRQFEECVKRARIVVSHAGMGTILTAMTTNTPIVIVPRKGALKEHRNDHQVSTANHFKSMGYAYVADTLEDIRRYISDLSLKSLHKVGDNASLQLVEYVKSFAEESRR